MLLVTGFHDQFQSGGLSGYSTEAGIMEMLARMRSDRFKVAAGCIEWQEEFQGYHRDQGIIVKTNDDLLSATRIGIMQLRSSKVVPLGSTRRDIRRPTSQSAENWDIFTGEPL